MAVSDICKNAILNYFANKIHGDLSRRVYASELDLVCDLGFDRKDVFDSLQELIDQHVLIYDSKFLFAGKNYL